MEDNKILKFIYTIFIGILIAVFVGVGVSTFYDEPEPPAYPESRYVVDDEASQKEDAAAYEEYDRQQAAYSEKSNAYSRNVSIITLLIAVSLLVVSIRYEKRMKLISEGILIGGVLTLVYAIIRGAGAGNEKYFFAVITIGLVVALYVGYHKFIHEEKKKKK